MHLFFSANSLFERVNLSRFRPYYSETTFNPENLNSTLFINIEDRNRAGVA
jgi:hypothetical protein